MKLSIVIPARNEEGSILPTIDGIVTVLERESIEYEVLVVDDGSSDGTRTLVDAVTAENPSVICRSSHYPADSAWPSDRGWNNSRAMPS